MMRRILQWFLLMTLLIVGLSAVPFAYADDGVLPKETIADPDVEKGHPNSSSTFVPAPAKDDSALMGSSLPPHCSGVSLSVGNGNDSVLPANAPTTVLRTSQVPSSYPDYLWNVAVDLEISHTFNADLDMTLTSPEGRIVTLSTDNGGSNDNVFAEVHFTDDANPGGQVPYITNAGLVTDHPYQDNVAVDALVSEEALSAFAGEDPAGDWTLTIRDDRAGDGGTVNYSGLNFYMLNTAPQLHTQGFGNFGNPVAIPSGPAVISSTIDVSGLTMPIVNVEVLTMLDHAYSADLDITLQSPAGTVVTLTSDNGGTNANVFSQTYWEANSNPGGDLPYETNDGLATDHAYQNGVSASPLASEESLGAFRGEEPNGTWILTISDDQAGDGGVLQAWNLDIDTGDCLEARAELSAYSLDVTHDPRPQETFATLMFTNTGNVDLAYTLREQGSACPNAATIPWAEAYNADGARSGTLSPNAATSISVAVDSRGLAAGAYSGNFCLETNDPDSAAIEIPVNLTVVDRPKSVTLSKTVGSTPNVCGTTDTIAVNAGSTVYYCYTVTNDGETPLVTHALNDVGQNHMVYSVPFLLAPGETVNSVEAGLVVSRTVGAFTQDTATWTGFSNVFYQRSSSDEPNGPTHVFIDISATGTALNLADDGIGTQPIGFPFALYGRTIDTLTVSNNGVLSSNAPRPGWGFNETMPSTRLGTALAVFWDDLDNDTGNVYVETRGTAPHRVFITQWERPHFIANNPPTAGLIRVQARLYESTNAIIFSYDDLSFNDPASDNGNSATVGIQKNAVVGDMAHYNNGTLAEDFSIRWQPVPGGDISNGAQDTTTVNIGEFPQINVFPDSLTETHDPAPQVTTDTFTIQNDGQADLIWTIEETSSSCADSSDVTWLSVAPEGATSAPGGFYSVITTFDSTGLANGTYTATLCILSNDPNTPVVELPVTLTVANAPVTHSVFMPLVKRAMK